MSPFPSPNSLTLFSPLIRTTCYHTEGKEQSFGVGRDLVLGEFNFFSSQARNHIDTAIVTLLSQQKVFSILKKAKWSWKGIFDCGSEIIPPYYQIFPSPCVCDQFLLNTTGPRNGAVVQDSPKKWIHTAQPSSHVFWPSLSVGLEELVNRLRKLAMNSSSFPIKAGRLFIFSYTERGCIKQHFFSTKINCCLMTFLVSWILNFTQYLVICLSRLCHMTSRLTPS